MAVMLPRKTPLKKSGKPLRRSRLKPMSKKRQRESKAYSLLRAAYLKANPSCQRILIRYGNWATCPNHSVDIHHVAGRLGGNYLNTETWMAVCRSCHDWIHANPKQAREQGLLR